MNNSDDYILFGRADKNQKLQIEKQYMPEITLKIHNSLYGESQSILQQNWLKGSHHYHHGRKILALLLVCKHDQIICYRI